jgi:hypothetical protein
MRKFQVFWTLLPVLLIAFDLIVIADYFECINAPGYNPRDGQAGFVRMGMFFGSFPVGISAAVIVIVNLILFRNKEKYSRLLFMTANILALAAALILPIANEYL